MRLVLGLLVVLFTLGGCASHLGAPSRQASPGWPDDADVVLREDLRYSPDDWPEPLQADVYLPDTPGLRPAVLVVHGGGWEGRSRTDMAAVAERLASHGFVAINVDYRFAPEYRFPARIQDLQQAMHWIHRHAEPWRIDTSRIAGVGYSSGAHSVSLLALIAGQGGELDRPYGGDDTRLEAVVAGGTPTDLMKFDDGRLVKQLLGGTRAQVPDRYRLASPVNHVHPGAPPFFLFHGGWDSLVPLDHAEDFYAKLKAQGVDSELYVQRLRGHITAFLTRTGAMDAATDFLERQLAPRIKAP